jgi:hypothetical protein
MIVITQTVLIETVSMEVVIVILVLKEPHVVFKLHLH